MKRRKFISDLGIVSAVALLPFQKIFGRRSVNADTVMWKELVEYARWCPSPHNVQPWKVKVISSNEADLYYDPQRIPIVVDGTSAFTTAGMGMFIECLNIAANKRGYKVIAEHEPDNFLDCTSSQLKMFAKLRLIATVESIDFDRELIRKRKTSRMHYDGRVIPAALVEDLRKISKQYGHEFVFSTNSELIKFAINLNSKSVLKRSEEAAARKEMCKWIRTTDEDAEKKRDGWWYRCTGIPGTMLRNFFFHHEHFEGKWKTRKANKMLNRSMAGTGNLAWIVGPFANRADWVNAGTMLQRLWLEITKHDVYMHPFGPVITTPDSHEKFRRKINFSQDKNNLWFLIRLGYSKDPPRSFRFEATDIFI